MVSRQGGGSQTTEGMSGELRYGVQTGVYKEPTGLQRKVQIHDVHVAAGGGHRDAVLRTWDKCIYTQTYLTSTCELAFED